ncbi:34001_t:CDS:2, partial [Racocetra persica]
ELENLSQALEVALKYLAIDGRIIVISYHSLEDRIVKQIFRKHSGLNFQIITKKPLTPAPQEVQENHRSRSAKMRIRKALGFKSMKAFLTHTKKAQALQKKMEKEGIMGVMNDPQLRKQMEELQKRSGGQSK